MTSGQETEWVYSFNPGPAQGHRTFLLSTNQQWQRTEGRVKTQSESKEMMQQNIYDDHHSKAPSTV